MNRRVVVALVVVPIMWSLTPVVPATAAGPSFIDPTARVEGMVARGELSYVAPFAQLIAGTTASQSIHVGSESNVQDSVALIAKRRNPGRIDLGEQVIIAHGAGVVGPSVIGETGTCPGTAAHCPSFVGFNAVVDGAIVEKDAMVLAMARVAPGVTIPSGRKVLPGKYVRNQNEVATKTAGVFADDRAFMAGVVEVNVAFAAGYSALQGEDPRLVRGISVNPQTVFNDRGQPKFQGVATSDPAFRNRIIGGVELTDSKAALSSKMGNAVSMRADEGEPFVVDKVTSVGHSHTLHALEHTGMRLGPGGRYGVHSLIHGGGASGVSTVTGANFTLRDLAVFFRSTAGDNVTIGRLSLVDGATLPSGTTVAPCTVIVGTTMSAVEWCPLPMPAP